MDYSAYKVFCYGQCSGTHEVFSFACDIVKSGSQLSPQHQEKIIKTKHSPVEDFDHGFHRLSHYNELTAIA
jgi:hypothetical protein